MASPGQDTAQFSFEPEIYGRIRREGTEAYLTFAAAPLGLNLAVPESDGPLPMRVLVRLGGNAEPLESDLRFPDELTDAGNPLRQWYARYADDFARFFPEQQWPSAPDPHDSAEGDHGFAWQRLERVSERFAEVTEHPLLAATGFFVLLRDHVDELAPLAQRLDIELGSLVLAAFEDLDNSDPMEAAREVYASLRESEGIPEGAGLAFAALVLGAHSSLTSELSNRWDHSHLVNAALESAGPAQAASILNIHKRATRDLPTAEDTLGVAPLVEGLRALLDDEETSLPLAIGVSAPWGAGKSSLMLQLRRALVDRRDSNRIWIPVRFDAWKFERGERLWAALSKAIYEQAEVALSPWKWTKFKVRLEIRRRGRRDRWLRLLALAVLLAIGLGALAVGADKAAVALLALFVAGLGGTVGGSWGLIADPFKRALDRYATQPKYEQQLGFTSEADSDIRTMTDELTRDPDQALVVFVDDLDRCSPRHIVDVVEAINQIFNSSDRAKCAFVLGMDRDMVAAGIEVAYGDTIARLPQSRRENFGYTFLSKLVQISVTLPQPTEEGVNRLLDSIVGPGAEAGGAPAVDEVAEMRRRLAAVRPENPADVHRVASEIERTESLSMNDRSALDEAVRLERAELFHGDSEDVRMAERRLVGHLERNPREIKRFDNAFRLQLHVANGTSGCELRFDLDDLVALGKSVVLRLRWPKLGEAIDSDGALLAELEAVSNGEGSPATDSAAGQWAENSELIQLLNDEPARRISRLSRQSFLRVS
jgi:KAP family P-loop domain